MSKRIKLLALGVISTVLLAVPATTSAITPLHLSLSPVGGLKIDDIGADPRLSTTGGTTVQCDSVSGNWTFNPGGTTGTIELTFGPNCTTNLGGTCTSAGSASSITTGILPLDLATVQQPGGGVVPGVLITLAGGQFASFTCHNVAGFLTVDSVVKGNGLIGKMTAPICGETRAEAHVGFNAVSNGFQEYQKLGGTETIYSLIKGEEVAALAATMRITFTHASTLTCT
ncbi:MAG TPA: hypothetical protein VF255_02450 [Solirubrobacterales bacterium]